MIVVFYTHTLEKPDLNSHTENEARDRLLPYLRTKRFFSFSFFLCVTKTFSRRPKGCRTLVRMRNLFKTR